MTSGILPWIFGPSLYIILCRVQVSAEMKFPATFWSICIVACVGLQSENQNETMGRQLSKSLLQPDRTPRTSVVQLPRCANVFLDLFGCVHNRPSYLLGSTFVPRVVQNASKLGLIERVLRSVWIRTQPTINLCREHSLFHLLFKVHQSWDWSNPAILIIPIVAGSQHHSHSI